MVNYARWALVRRLRSRRQVHEIMREFWENHFNVPANGDAAFTWRIDYGVALGERALGSFEDLLQTAITHPAMLIFLDNAVSTAGTPTRTSAASCSSCTPSGQGPYDEHDVKDSARILTGLAGRPVALWEASYREQDHARGQVTVMDFKHANASGDGRPVTREYLSYLAHHPATARRIARKLAVKFVRDDAIGRPRVAPREGLPGERHRRSSQCSGPSCGPTNSRRRSPSRCATPARTSWPPTGRST